MREAIYELLDFTQDMAEDLGSQREFDYIRTLLASPHGTGADRQIDIYRETGDVQKVIGMLMEQTLQGVRFEHELQGVR
jgi:carboxylate-amine ligase